MMERDQLGPAEAYQELDLDAQVQQAVWIVGAGLIALAAGVFALGLAAGVWLGGPSTAQPRASAAQDERNCS